MKYQSGYAFTLLLLLAGCGGGGGSSSDSGTTQLNLAISDAPVDSAQQVCHCQWSESETGRRC